MGIKYTPGYWETGKEGTIAEFCVYADHPNDEDSMIRVASCDEHEFGQISKEQCTANARLLSCAPEMHQLLSYIMKHGTCYTGAIESNRGEFPDTDFEAWGEEVKEILEIIDGEQP